MVRRILPVALSVLLDSIEPVWGQPVGWGGLQVKALSGIGLVAEGPSRR